MDDPLGGTPLAQLSTTPGAESAPSTSTRPAKRAPRDPPPTLPPELPARAADVTDHASLVKVVLLLQACVISAVQAGKSVTATNKKRIVLAAEETRRAMAFLQRRDACGPPATSTTAAETSAPPASTNPAAALPAPAARAGPAAVALTEEATDGLKRELAACVREEFGKLKAELTRDARRAAARAPQEPTYAQVARQEAKPPPPATRPAIIVAAKAAVTSQQETVQAFRRSISFRTSDYAPVMLRPVARNKLRVEFETAQQRDEALQRLGGDAAEVTAERATALKPLLLLKGVSRSTPREDLAGIVKTQNNCSEGEIKVKFVRNNRNEKLYNAVLETSPDAWRKLFGLGRVCVDHQRVQVEQFSPFIQCYSCLQFGHLQSRCRQDVRPCARCASTAHQEADCPAKEHRDSIKCYNCANRNAKYNGRTPTNHKATSASCPVACAMRARIESRVDYGSA